MAVLKTFSATGAALAVLASLSGVAQAMPLVPAASVQAQMAPHVETVQWRHGPPPPYYYGHPGYYHGYHGYRDYHPGYRRHHDGYWYPLAAFAAGAIIGGAIAAEPRPAPPPPVYYDNGINPRHYQWCESRYRTYDPYSNTFVNYNGVRQQCFSPYY
ncbi:BA14K family protein [Allorhizobium sp. BGMRC 0089]|uniref:BA14K family protein n=1 Tax=Allorhizobium sonneratiae TaxID=2934936 RepID=UPI0020345657|nr:BA14K family protein [Allorhizobium sonneratiae]MCM2294539.1 BA14K family protein [Allorhizobium sonneratiae]